MSPSCVRRYTCTEYSVPAVVTLRMMLCGSAGDDDDDAGGGAGKSSLIRT